ncbi:3-hydroxyacyl-ACP dehydratase [Dyadobacter arcticus]|uniref:3-hydroxyacyl-[acyl-carrier-protein] dehydratase n=1 Tax=Dyadobacter arcticus TaxID=1078754 RepID=A0ABX0UU12_9BACT|nr:3-hydroxyacyl-ACP dehydratase [Dyadobacter arcticus]NIJ55135.1 3-hydroxyacyl-[acyl-carrier-protein] dehydratase [Dyadobacter arcticus]
MLENDLFSILKMDRADGEIVSEVSINATHPIYKGHFPGSPVTPGVILLQMVKAVMQNHLQRDPRLNAIKTCKFLEILNPDKTKSFNIKISFKQLERLEVVATGYSADVVFFKLQATYH